MSLFRTFFAVTLLGLPTLSLDASPAVVGHYLETKAAKGLPLLPRTRQVAQDAAWVVWSIEDGKWDSEKLDGLKIALYIESEGPLHSERQGNVRSRVWIDRTASEKQGEALVALVTALAPEYVKNITRIDRETISFEHPEHEPEVLPPGASTPPKEHQAKLSIGRLAAIELTLVERAQDCDGVCSKDIRPIPSVSASAHVHTATVKRESFRGQPALVRDPDGALLGLFAR